MVNHNYVIGLLYIKKGYGLFKSVIFEYFNTFDQSGPGLPDPIVNGQLVVPSEIDDIDQFMLENFNTVTVGFSQLHFNNYLEQNFNYGYKFNGRDDHYNNYLYPAGLAYHEEAIGNSLFTSKSNISHLKGGFDGAYDTYFVNNRIIAYHFALKGYITPNLSYRTKLTYSINYGSYAGANKGRFSWGSKEDPAYYNSYYFKDGLKQAYTFFELNYSPFENKGASFTSSIAYDFGEMYDNFGVLFGFHYNGFFSLKKSKKD